MIYDPIGQFLVHLRCHPFPPYCKLQEEPMKTERVILMTKSNRGIFTNQKDVTLG